MKTEGVNTRLIWKYLIGLDTLDRVETLAYVYEVIRSKILESGLFFGLHIRNC